MDKSWIVAILFTAAVAGLVFISVLMIVGVTDNDEKKNEIICDELGMEILSVSRQVFGDDYVVCYNINTNETRRIVI